MVRLTQEEIMTLLESLAKDAKRLLQILNLISMERDELYDAAYSFIGTDASPDDLAPDELGCSESISRIIQKAFPTRRFPTLLSTRLLWEYLSKSPSFKQIDEPTYGCIVISPTGSGNGTLTNGHVGVLGKNLSHDGTPWIMSNDSRMKTFEVNFTLGQWKRYYQGKGGFPVLFFLPLP